jgi:16S rRNA processing protein RimM
VTTPSRPDGWVRLGRICGVFGVQGWVKVFSETRPREAIVNYSPWFVKIGETWREIEVEAGRAQGQGVVVKLAGIDDRDHAAGLLGAAIAVKPEQLPPLKRGEYYWAQLVGLEVINLQGARLGKVIGLFETGANDVIVVRGGRERWLPATPAVIRDVDLPAGVLRVDWDADF